MKRFIVIILILCFSLLIIGCGDIKTINGYTYDTYGIFNKIEKKNPDIEYRLIIGNVIWSALLVETIIAPIYFLGFSLYEPICVKDNRLPKGAVSTGVLYD